MDLEVSFQRVFQAPSCLRVFVALFALFAMFASNFVYVLNIYTTQLEKALKYTCIHSDLMISACFVSSCLFALPISAAWRKLGPFPLNCTALVLVSIAQGSLWSTTRLLNFYTGKPLLVIFMYAVSGLGSLILNLSCLFTYIRSTLKSRRGRAVGFLMAGSQAALGVFAASYFQLRKPDPSAKPLPSNNSTLIPIAPDLPLEIAADVYIYWGAILFAASFCATFFINKWTLNPNEDLVDDEEVVVGGSVVVANGPQQPCSTASLTRSRFTSPTTGLDDVRTLTARAIESDQFGVGRQTSRRYRTSSAYTQESDMYSDAGADEGLTEETPLFRAISHESGGVSSLLLFRQQSLSFQFQSLLWLFCLSSSVCFAIQYRLPAMVTSESSGVVDSLPHEVIFSVAGALLGSLSLGYLSDISKEHYSRVNILLVFLGALLFVLLAVTIAPGFQYSLYLLGAVAGLAQGALHTLVPLTILDLFGSRVFPLLWGLCVSCWSVMCVLCLWLYNLFGLVIFAPNHDNETCTGSDCYRYSLACYAALCLISLFLSSTFVSCR